MGHSNLLSNSAQAGRRRTARASGEQRCSGGESPLKQATTASSPTEMFAVCPQVPEIALHHCLGHGGSRFCLSLGLLFGPEPPCSSEPQLRANLSIVSKNARRVLRAPFLPVTCEDQVLPLMPAAARLTALLWLWKCSSKCPLREWMPVTCGNHVLHTRSVAARLTALFWLWKRSVGCEQRLID